MLLVCLDDSHGGRLPALVVMCLRIIMVAGCLCWWWVTYMLLVCLDGYGSWLPALVVTCC